MFQTLLHGSAFDQDQSDANVMSCLRTEAEAMRILKAAIPEPLDAYLCETSGGSNTLRVKIRQRRPGDARFAISSLFGGIMRLKHVFVFDEDIDIRDQKQVEWAMGTRFQADKDTVMITGMRGRRASRRRGS